jgi:uncharacterized coiled-coil protein SlyX
MDSELIPIEKLVHALEMKLADQARLIHKLEERLGLVENYQRNTERFGEAIRQTIEMMEEAEKK